MLPTLISLIISISNPITLSATGSAPVVLASHDLPLNDRYGNTFVNDVFKDNILLTMSYMDGQVKTKNDIDWNKVESDFTYQFTLNPGEEFAFHDQTEAKYNSNIVKTTNAHYDFDEGFKSDGYLTGDGVCHLASVIYWAAKDAGLAAYAPTNHNFANIPDIPKEYGVAIFSDPTSHEGGETNLYITNNKEKPVTFVFDYKNSDLKVSVEEN